MQEEVKMQKCGCLKGRSCNSTPFKVHSMNVLKVRLSVYHRRPMQEVRGAVCHEPCTVLSDPHLPVQEVR